MKSQTDIFVNNFSSPYLVLEITKSIFDYPENSTESIYPSLIAI
jgi:hypothetical protein